MMSARMIKKEKNCPNSNGVKRKPVQGGEGEETLAALQIL
jgi:hypothetical protein